MNAVWIVLGVGIVIAVGMVARSWLRRRQDVDLGTVSHQWIAEQRPGHGHDTHR